MFCIFLQDLWAGLTFVLQYSECAMENVNLVSLCGAQNQLDLCNKELFLHMRNNIHSLLNTCVLQVLLWKCKGCLKVQAYPSCVTSLSVVLEFSCQYSLPMMPLKRLLSLNWASVWNSVFWYKGRPLSVKTSKTYDLSMFIAIYSAWIFLLQWMLSILKCLQCHFSAVQWLIFY